MMSSFAPSADFAVLQIASHRITSRGACVLS
jgi:hypothetical protein